MNRHYTFWKIFLVAISISLILFGCVTQSKTSQGIAKESALTPGMAKTYIIPGKTSQTEVLEVFGPPDLVTHRGGMDVWTYDKISHEVTGSGGYLSIIIAGGAGGTGRQSSRSVMLIIYFDENEIVSDYKLSAANF